MDYPLPHLENQEGYTQVVLIGGLNRKICKNLTDKVNFHEKHYLKILIYSKCSKFLLLSSKYTKLLFEICRKNHLGPRKHV